MNAIQGLDEFDFVSFCLKYYKMSLERQKEYPNLSVKNSGHFEDAFAELREKNNKNYILCLFCILLPGKTVEKAIE